MRYPTVGPWWVTLAARIVADPIVTASSGASWNVRFEGTSSSRTGNNGGERYIEIRSARCCTGDVGPQIWMSRPGREQRAEEAEALEMIEVEVGEQDVQLDAEGLPASPRRGVASPYPRRAPASARSKAAPRRTRCCRRTSRCRRRAPRPSPGIPRCGLPSGAVFVRARRSQNTEKTPCISPLVPNSGYAVFSTAMRSPVYVVTMSDWCAGLRSKYALPAGESRRRIGSPSGVVSSRAAPNSPDGISPISANGFPRSAAAASL